MAAGYAAFRPPIHPHILERAFQHLGRTGQVRRALDVGCGAGSSTKALRKFAEQRIGIEPSFAMLKWAAETAPDAGFVVGQAEALPIRESSIDVITAAGSLNYVDLQRFFDEANRVLAGNGLLVVYDFSAGRSFRNSSDLDTWFADFAARYPMPESEATYLSPEILAQLDARFAAAASATFEIGVPMARDFYLEYMMTETNVAAAVRSGTSYRSIREWAARSLGEIWGDQEKDVLFRGYYVCLTLTRRS